MFWFGLQLNNPLSLILNSLKSSATFLLLLASFTRIFAARIHAIVDFSIYLRAILRTYRVLVGSGCCYIILLYILSTSMHGHMPLSCRTSWTQAIHTHSSRQGRAISKEHSELWAGIFGYWEHFACNISSYESDWWKKAHNVYSYAWTCIPKIGIYQSCGLGITRWFGCGIEIFSHTSRGSQLSLILVIRQTTALMDDEEGTHNLNRGEKKREYCHSKHTYTWAVLCVWKESDRIENDNVAKAIFTL